MQQFLVDNAIQIHGVPLKARVEPDEQRKAWLRLYFETFRAMREMVEDSNKAATEVRTFSIYYQGFPKYVARVDKKAGKMVFNDDVLASLGLNRDAINAKVASS